jgi:hypothetical protein
MTHFHPQAVEPLPLSMDTILRPVVVPSETPNIHQFITAPSEAGILSLQGVPTPVVAQLEDVDILRDIVNLWNTFIETGQVWALLIGLIIGYFLRGLTTYS